VVRCDVAAIIGFLEREQWPDGAESGAPMRAVLTRRAQLLDPNVQSLFGVASRVAARSYFENGGQLCHLFSVCVERLSDLADPGLVVELFKPLLDILRVDEEIALLAVPALAKLGWSRGSGGVVITAGSEPALDLLLAHCREMVNRFLVIDAPAGLHGSALTNWLERFRARSPKTRSFGAVYYPWVAQGGTLAPPSGAVLGVYSRVEREHQPFGVVWAPANEPLRGVGMPEIQLTWAEVRELATSAVNPLVLQPGRGMVVYGARTLSSEAAWEFINSRRVVSMVAEQLRRDSEWAVFEPNDRSLWKRLSRDVGFRLNELWEGGVLAGAIAQKGFFIQCDDETNTREDREAGRVVVKVNLQPVTTTEQINIELVLGDSTEIRTGGV